MRTLSWLIPVALVSACSTTDWAEMRANPREYFNLNAPVQVTDARIDGQQVVLKRGQPLVVTLEEDVASGQRWEMRPLSGDAVIAPIRHDLVTKAGTEPATSAPGEAQFRLRGVAAGTATVVLEYRRPFEQPAKTVRFDVVVR